MTHLRITCILCLLAIIGAASAQRHSISHFGVENGLSNNYILSLAQDRKGYIWIATESGLNRFDGRQFTVYNKSNSGLSSNELNALLADPTEDKVWIGTQRDGLCCFDYATETITALKSPDDGLISNDIPYLAAAADSGIWITHYHMGVQHFDPKRNVFRNYDRSSIPHLPWGCWTAMEDGRGNLYIGHVKDGLSIVDTKRKTLRNFRHRAGDPSSLPGDEVYSLCIDRDKNVWVGTNQGAALFRPATDKFISFKHRKGDAQSLLPGTVMDIKQMKNGNIRFATNMGGISVLDLQSNTFTDARNIRFSNITVTNDEYGLTGAYVRRLLQDSFGNLWIGSYRDGLDFISHEPNIFNRLHYTAEKQGKSRYKQVWSLCLDHKGQLWMGGESELAVSKQGEQLRIIPLPTSTLHPHAYVRAIHEDRQHRIWVGTWEAGLFYYEPEKRRFTSISKDGLPADVRCLSEDPDGKLWIGTRTGVYSYHHEKLMPEEELNAQLTDLLVQDICRDAHGRLWVGTFGKGVFIFTPQGKLLLNHQKENGFPSNAVNAFTTDSQGRIWVATREGAVLFADTGRPESYTIFGSDEGLRNTQVRAIHEDRNGTVWMSTNAGISRLDEQRKTCYNYDHRDGIPLGDFMDGASVSDGNGTLYFGSQNGTCYFDPSSLSAMRIVAPVTITGFFVYSKQTESKDIETSLPLAAGEIGLPYNQNTFKISFNVLDYTQSSQVEFAYMMEGLEDVWYSTQGENQVTFRNIPPGDYTFKVKTRLRNQEWEEKVATLPITISPPFWLAWYTKLLYFFVAAAFVYIIIGFYKRKLDLESSLEVERKNSRNKQELNDERLRFYTNITHELRTPLTLILGPLEDLLSDSSLSPKHANRISIIHDSAARLLNLINSILEFRKTETQNRKLSVARGDLSELVQEIGLRYKELNRNPKVDFHVRIDTEDTLLFFDADMLTTILNNLLSNAAKYTSEGDITLSLSSLELGGVKYTEISISDTGHGIAEEALPHIFERYYQANSQYQASGSGIGLALVKGLADLHEATLEVSSRLEEGTTFRLRLLTDNFYPNALHTDKHPSNEEPGNTTDNPLPEENTEAEEPSEDTRPLLLVVEDNPDIREYIRQSLSDDFDVLTAEDGNQGWTLAQERIPNIIVSDIMMPVMDGIELCRLVKDDIRTSHIPVILLTAKDSLHDKEEGYTAGADSYLTKPFSAKLLHSRINNLLEVRKKMAAGLTAFIPHTEPVAETTETLSPLDNEFLQRITKIIEDNLEMEKMDIAFIADKMCMSHSTLYRKIKGVTDMSANEFIRKVKMRNGVRLLLSERYSISEISYMTGFSSVAYFRQCFKNEFGMAPSEYLKQKK
ncbi:hybrid sensor histidine kinase/response regulator [Bacteroides heparinolyticus]|uniref:hybrid sensor histidine kinase/response regulator transcription factor n=1 Tax=Prevotella heparinolytica TaxID=28113 RepID=UPI000D027D8D|nr:hybrid sensor histidine kinase/response regulator transcription factor [Bacteroides heparinolyticus]AVM58300.1 hybrid sensor histidine kinase/response regulator [Bacteroides heparinolyticus]